MENGKNVTILIPTLNEAGNVKALLSELSSRYPAANVIVSDDGSTDGTRQIVSSLAKRRRAVMLLDRKDSRVHGLTASVLDAAKAARTEFIVVMDGDLQHPPESVAEIIGELRKGAAVAVGCRRCVAGWAPHRKAMSLGAMALGKSVLAMRGSASCSDVMSGFFGVRRKLLVDRFRTRPAAFELRGYKVLLDLLKLLPGSTMVAEIPYDFGLRKTGRSKIGVSHIAAYVRSLAR